VRRLRSRRRARAPRSGDAEQGPWLDCDLADDSCGTMIKAWTVGVLFEEGHGDARAASRMGAHRGQSTGPAPTLPVGT
jgi:hypothetical protein